MHIDQTIINDIEEKIKACMFPPFNFNVIFSHITERAVFSQVNILLTSLEFNMGGSLVEFNKQLNRIIALVPESAVITSSPSEIQRVKIIFFKEYK